jgi:hypothetical protein
VCGQQLVPFSRLFFSGFLPVPLFEFGFRQSPEMLEVFATIRKLAISDVPVLILGESGTGKELVARALHRESLRRDGPFIPINCGAIQWRFIAKISRGIAIRGGLRHAGKDRVVPFVDRWVPF